MILEFVVPEPDTVRETSMGTGVPPVGVKVIVPVYDPLEREEELI